MFNFFKNLLRDQEDTPTFGKGLIASPADSRDYALSSIMPIVKRYPESVPMPFDLTISNQGSAPSCVGHSLAGIKQYLELKEKEVKTFDGDWLYAECKKVDGIPNVQGTYLRTGLEVLRKVGAKPFGESDPTPYKIHSYVRNDEATFEGIKKAIFLYGIVLAGFIGSNPGWQGEIVRPPRVGEATWGHAVRLVGYEKDYLIGQNSWGENAHRLGHFKVPRTYMPFESWIVILDLPNKFEPLPIKNGWLAVNFIEQFNGTWRTTANVNVRTGAGTYFNIIRTLPKGTIVQLTGEPRKSANGYMWEQIIVL